MKTIGLIPALLFLFFSINAQNLVVDSVHVTGSTCYNDGTLALNVSGGTGPYHFIVTSGPALPNVNYPIYPDSSNYFVSLHAGSYVVQVSDNGGNTISYPVTIPGTYQFPTVTASVQLDSIFAHPSFGLPPYLFCISSSGPNGPFGPLQSSNVFPSLCNGPYYIRVQDSCGNFYTTAVLQIQQLPFQTIAICNDSAGLDQVSVYGSDLYSGNPPFRYICKSGAYVDSNATGHFTPSFHCVDTVYTIDRCYDTSLVIVDCHPLFISYCSNFSDSSAYVSVWGGTPPYKYRFYELDTITGVPVFKFEQDSGDFHHLQYTSLNEKIWFEVVDACGRINGGEDSYLKFKAANDCPFNGRMYITFPGLPGYLGPPDSLVVTCLTCNPPQTFIGLQHYFTNLDTGSYTVRITDTCGETRDMVLHIPDTIGINSAVEYISCNDVKISAYSTDNIQLNTGVIYTLHGQFNGADTIFAVNSTGYFLNLPTGIYFVDIHYDGCLDGSQGFYLPHFDGYCTLPYFDTTCQLKLIVNYSGGDLHENYSLISNDSIIYNETPPGPNNGIHFNITPGNYVLHSDSGCSVNQNFNYNYFLKEIHSVNCINQGTIRLYEYYPNASLCTSLQPFYYTLTNAAGAVISQIPSSLSPYNDTAKFFNLDTGVYIARTYFSYGPVIFDTTHLANGNATCFLDSMIIIIAPHIVPELHAENATVCGDTGLAAIHFTISDGFAPYYINIPGYLQIVTDSTSGILPGIPLGNHTAIINDACGISSSLSISVVDSCIDCGTVRAKFTVPDSMACTGDALSFSVNDTAGTHYRWLVNGISVSDSAGVVFLMDNSGTAWVQCIASRYACYDTASAFIRVPPTPQFNLGNDTLLCDKFTYVLSSGIFSTYWSTGMVDSNIIVTTPGLYWGIVTGRCSAFSDSITIDVMRCPSQLHVPDAFTPNGDGTNDFFTVFGNAIGDYEIRIYNRWGELVYNSNDAGELNNLARGWDGTYKGKVQNIGTYVYYISATGDDGKIYHEKGNLTLIR